MSHFPIAYLLRGRLQKERRLMSTNSVCFMKLVGVMITCHGVTKTTFTKTKAEDHRQPGGGVAADIATNKSRIAHHCK